MYPFLSPISVSHLYICQLLQEKEIREKGDRGTHGNNDIVIEMKELKIKIKSQARAKLRSEPPATTIVAVRGVFGDVGSRRGIHGWHTHTLDARHIMLLRQQSVIKY